MTRIGIDAHFKGGSVRMAAASAAIDPGTPIDIVLNTVRWTSWTVFNTFYNRSRLNDVCFSTDQQHFDGLIGLSSLGRVLLLKP